MQAVCWGHLLIQSEGFDSSAFRKPHFRELSQSDLIHSVFLILIQHGYMYTSKTMVRLLK